MKRYFALAAMTFVASTGVQAADCSALLKEHLQTDLSLSYREFDQTQGKGFRAMGDCDKETADLIEAYIQKNGEASSLVWHVAQLRAMAGDYQQAIIQAKRVLHSKEDAAKIPLRWNDYVLATIAFLENDKASLIAHRNAVAEGAEAYPGNKRNLELLDGLIRDFGSSYKYAYGRKQ